MSTATLEQTAAGMVTRQERVYGKAAAALEADTGLGFSAEQRASMQRAAEVWNRLGREASPKQLTEELRSRQSKETFFSAAADKDIKLRLGGLKAKERSDGSIALVNRPEDFITPDEETSMQENLRAGSETVDRVRGVLDYTSVIIESQRTGKSANEILKKKGIGGATDTERATFLEGMRTKAIDTLLNMNTIQKLMPELDGLPEDSKRTLVEQAFINDPELSMKISQRMAEVQKEARELPTEEHDPKWVDAIGRFRTANESMVAQAQTIAQQLKDKGFPVQGLDYDKYAETIMTQLSGGASVETVLNNIRAEIGNADTQYVQALRQYEAYAKVQKLTADLGEAKNTTAATEIQGRLTQAKTDFDNIKAANPKTAEFAQKVTKAGELTRMLSKERNADGRVTSEVGRALETAVQARTERAKAEREVNNHQANENRLLHGSRAKRLEAEAALVDKLNDVLSESVLDVVDARYDVLVKAKAEELKEHEAENRKKNAADIANHRSLLDKMQSNWISFNETGRGKHVKTGKIAVDIRTLAYRGEEGLKVLIARDLGLQVLDRNVQGGKRDFNPNTDTIDMLGETVDRPRFEAAYKEYAQQYRDKLIGDFFMARNISNRATSLNMKEHEWNLLFKAFGPSIEQGIQAKEGYQTFMKSLADRGIILSGRKKLALYGMGGLLGLIAGPGGAVAGMAVGAGASAYLLNRRTGNALAPGSA